MLRSVIRRTSFYIKNLGVMRGLGFVVHKKIGKYINPGATLVYGSLGEDALLWFYITEVMSIRRPGFYVDVGCNHPVIGSNTYFLYQLGWRGIAIDADADSCHEYRNIRPRDYVKTALISDSLDEMPFYCFESSRINTVDPDSAARMSRGNEIKEVRKYLPKTLNVVLEECKAPHNFELLKIDVEGHDLAVLDSIDLRTYQPKLIVVELHGETIESVSSSEIFKKLSSAGYSMVSLAGYNGFFLKNE